MNHRFRTPLGSVALVATASLALLAGCSSASEDPGTAETADEVALYQSVRSLSNSYHANWVEGGEMFAESIGSSVTTITDEADSQRQLSQVRALGASGEVFAVNVDPNTSADTEALVRAVADAGGFVVTQWSKPDDLNPWDVGDAWVAHVSFDGRVSGKQVAEALFERMGGAGNIVAIQGILNNVASQQRFEGLQNALAENPDITLLEDQTGNFSRSEGLTVAQTLIAKHGDEIDGIWAANDEMALGALEALRAAGLEGQIPIVGFDAVPEALEAIQDPDSGYVASVSTDPWWQGGAGLSLAHKAATGELAVGDLSEDERAFFGTQIIVTAENAGDFVEAPELSALQSDFDDPWLRSEGPIN